jgi:hypothetical protein
MSNLMKRLKREGGDPRLRYEQKKSWHKQAKAEVARLRQGVDGFRPELKGYLADSLKRLERVIDALDPERKEEDEEEEPEPFYVM